MSNRHARGKSRRNDEDTDILTYFGFFDSLKKIYMPLVEAQAEDWNPAEIRSSLNRLAEDLIRCAEIYRKNREEEVVVPRVSQITRTLDHLANYSLRSSEKWDKLVMGLDADAIGALLGGFPFADAQFSAAEFDESGRLVPSLDIQPAFTPAHDLQKRQEIKHQLRESQSGLVKSAFLPGFIELYCMESDQEQFADVLSDLLGHRTQMREIAVITPSLLEIWQKTASDFFSIVIPDKFANLANEMEDVPHLSPDILLNFVADNASLLFDEATVEPEARLHHKHLALETMNLVLSGGDHAFRQRGFAFLALKNPSGFQRALAKLVERIELQYRKQKTPTGMGKRITRSYVAPATWTMIIQVLDLVWPAEKGPLTKSTSGLVCSIAELTFNRGELSFQMLGKPVSKVKSISNTGIGNRGGQEKPIFQIDYVRKAVARRNASYQLNCALEFLERKVSEARAQFGASDHQAIRLEASVRVLRAWREEMDWQLTHGVYEKEQKRASSMEFGRFPYMSPSHPIEERVNKILNNAQSHIDNMVIKMSASSTKGTELKNAG